MSPMLGSERRLFRVSHSANCAAAVWLGQNSSLGPSCPSWSSLPSRALAHPRQSQNQWTRKLSGRGLFFLSLLMGNFLSQRGSLQQLLLSSRCRVVWARSKCNLQTGKASQASPVSLEGTKIDFSGLEEIHIFKPAPPSYNSRVSGKTACLFAGTIKLRDKLKIIGRDQFSQLWAKKRESERWVITILGGLGQVGCSGPVGLFPSQKGRFGAKSHGSPLWTSQQATWNIGNSLHAPGMGSLNKIWMGRGD